jgi:predicted dehydrogenase
MATKKKVRLAMIGSGGNARWHMGTMLGIEGVEIVALVDTAEAALEAAVKQHPALDGVPQFADHKKMLKAAEPNAVLISTPHTSHCKQIIDSLSAGANVLCEKPMVCSVADAKKVLNKVKKTGLVMGLSYQRHFAGPYRYCKEVIAKGELGKVNFISCLQSQNWYRGCVLTNTWRSKMAFSGGGQLNDSGSHLLDIVLWMSGLQPAEVFAFQDNLGSEVEILTSMSVKFDGGALANFSVVGHAVNWHEDITIWCEDGTLAIRGNEVWRWDGGEERKVVADADLPKSWTPDENFIAAIRGKETIQAPPEMGLKVIQLSEAAWKSAADHAPAAVVR